MFEFIERRILPIFFFYHVSGYRALFRLDIISGTNSNYLDNFLRGKKFPLLA